MNDDFECCYMSPTSSNCRARWSQSFSVRWECGVGLPCMLQLDISIITGTHGTSSWAPGSVLLYVQKSFLTDGFSVGSWQQGERGPREEDWDMLATRGQGLGHTRSSYSTNTARPKPCKS